MKTYKNLYPQVCSFENLHGAYYKARKGKRGKAHVAGFERNDKNFPARSSNSFEPPSGRENYINLIFTLQT